MVPDGFITNTSNEPNTMTAWPFGQIIYISYWPEPEPKVWDERKNPKMWRIWFREFLLEKIPAAIETLLLPAGWQAMIARRCRSAPFAEKAWKMKAWKQAL